MLQSRGVLYAVAAAVLFGASTPAVKAFLGGAAPPIVAGLLYLGSGIGLLLVWLLGRRSRAKEAPLIGHDWSWLIAASLFGGIIGPLLFVVGLAHTTAATASLLLNVEAVATALIAWISFREHASPRTVSGMIAIVAGAVLLTWSGQPTVGALIGPGAIVGACLAWAIDNNVTRNISGSDAVQITWIKSLVAGTVNTTLALTVLHVPLPNFAIAAGVGLVGLFGYGVSLVCYILALRNLGTARTGAYFSTAPFIGAAIAVGTGALALDARFVGSALLMAIGVWLHVTEQHSHEHMHEEFEHSHLHVHDAHHQHEHDADTSAAEPHTHRHRHARLVHSHPHYPDLHHRHGH